MRVTHLRWLALTLSFVILIFGGLAGLHLGNFLPTLACPYTGPMRGGDCFFMRLQFALQTCDGNAFKTLAEIFLYFSLLVLLIGRAWCGWLCPFGFVQDLLDHVRKMLRLDYIRFSERLRRRLGWIKWVFFLIALLLPLWVAYPILAYTVATELSLPFCQLCPAKHILPLMIGNTHPVALNFKNTTTFVMSLLGLSFAITTLVGALLKRRFWCAYCPMGLLMSLYKRIGFIKLKKDGQKCTLCEICYNVCPMEIKAVYLERNKENVTFSDCILCLKCVEHCPEESALRATFLGKTLYKASSQGFFKRFEDEKTKKGDNLSH